MLSWRSLLQPYFRLSRGFAKTTAAFTALPPHVPASVFCPRVPAPLTTHTATNDFCHCKVTDTVCLCVSPFMQGFGRISRTGFRWPLSPKTLFFQPNKTLLSGAQAASSAWPKLRPVTRIYATKRLGNLYYQYVMQWPPLKAGAIALQLNISVMPRKKTFLDFTKASHTEGVHWRSV